LVRIVRDIERREVCRERGTPGKRHAPIKRRVRGKRESEMKCGKCS